MRTTLIALAILAAQWGRAEPVSYTVGGQVVYEGSSPMGTWRGTNTTVAGSLIWDKQSGVATGAVTVALAQWNSGNAVRDGHGREMFQSDRFSKATFTFVRVENKKVTGTLELHGVKLPVELPGELREDAGRLTFDANVVLRLSDWKLTRPNLLGAEVANEVKVHIHGEATSK